MRVFFFEKRVIALDRRTDVIGKVDCVRDVEGKVHLSSASGTSLQESFFYDSLRHEVVEDSGATDAILITG